MPFIKIFAMKTFVSTIIVASFCTIAQADVPLGLWKSPPDETGMVMHVRTKSCGTALCGRVERAKDRRGYDTPSSVVGRKMLLDLRLRPDGGYEGQVWKPARNQLVPVIMQVEGNKLHLRNCDDAGCREDIWTRLR